MSFGGCAIPVSDSRTWASMVTARFLTLRFRSSFARIQSFTAPILQSRSAAVKATDFTSRRLVSLERGGYTHTPHQPTSISWKNFFPANQRRNGCVPRRRYSRGMRHYTPANSILQRKRELNRRYSRGRVQPVQREIDRRYFSRIKEAEKVIHRGIYGRMIRRSSILKSFQSLRHLAIHTEITNEKRQMSNWLSDD